LCSILAIANREVIKFSFLGEKELNKDLEYKLIIEGVIRWMFLEDDVTYLGVEFYREIEDKVKILMERLGKEDNFSLFIYHKSQ